MRKILFMVVVSCLVAALTGCPAESGGENGGETEKIADKAVGIATLKAVTVACEQYYMENGEYPDHFNKISGLLDDTLTTNAAISGYNFKLVKTGDGWGCYGTPFDCSEKSKSLYISSDGKFREKTGIHQEGGEGWTEVSE